jgi:hypothetical protein
MAKRGKIVRDPTAGPGLVMVQGRQHAFPLEGVWRSDALPRPGVIVDVEFDDAGRIRAMLAVPEARLAREQAEAALAFARSKGAEVGAGLVARFGLAQLAALALLVLGWFWLGAIRVEASILGHWQVTFWQALGALNAGRPLEALGARAPGAGAYGVGALLSLAGPLAAHIWHDKRAHLAALLPLAFMVLIALHLADAAGAGSTQALSLGAGAYVSALAGLYFALTGIRRFLVAQARDETVFYEND